MRSLFIAACILGLATVAFLGAYAWRHFQLWPESSSENVELTADKRVLLQRLRAERKFQPHDYPPLGYTGAETPADEARAAAAVNKAIDAILAHLDGPIHAEAISTLIASGMGEVGWLATEDRDRVHGYMLEIWYLLGFKGATGRFSYGSGFSKPDGYGEPLPPGWTAPDVPRPIN